VSLSVDVGQEGRRRVPSRRALALAVVLTAAAALLSIPAQTTVAVGQPVPVLGAHRHLGHLGGIGWGTAHPRQLSNGGDGTGHIHRIHWKTWGAERAFGHGMVGALRPRGGPFRRLVRIRLRAQLLGHCPGLTRPAYRRLYVRVALRPGAPVGPHWHLWGPPRNGHICQRNP
jgi:hypothetical protein